MKQFVEERELTVLLAVDVSASGSYGSTGQSKREVATEIAALLGFSAIRNNDRVGLVAFSDRIEKYVPPRKGRMHVLRVIRELLFLAPQRAGTDIAQAVAFLDRVQKRRCVVFLISDFLTQGYERRLRVTSRHHEVIAIAVTDPREHSLPPAGLITMEDAETGELMVVDAGDRRVRQEYERLAGELFRQRNTALESVKVDRVDVLTGGDYVEPLAHLFHRRARRA